MSRERMLSSRRTVLPENSIPSGFGVAAAFSASGAAHPARRSRHSSAARSDRQAFLMLPSYRRKSYRTGLR